MEEGVAGRKPVLEALRAGRVNKLLVANGSHGLEDHYRLAREKGIPVQLVDKPVLDRTFPGTHQGVIAMASPVRYYELDDLISLAAERGEDPLLLLLDGVEDPQNLGAVLRVAEATGVHGVVLPRHRAVAVTPAVAKASAGAAEYVRVARVSGLPQAMEDLKKRGLWVAGADAGAPEVLWQQTFTGPLALVIGGEGKGLGRLVKERCDFLVRLPMAGKVNSLNAAVAAAVILYEVFRQRLSKNGKMRPEEM